MPYIAHDQFHQYYDKMSPVETQLYLRNLLVALKRVHDFNVIHRDVKPSNFLYNRKQQKFLLVDFGLAQDISRRRDVALKKVPAEDRCWHWRWGRGESAG
uniref:non-specific serine/threonine protein kinase n=1 Tax=Culex pipiens TaxID=7175 RepID=A0A8D8F6T7_CULPI